MIIKKIDSKEKDIKILEFLKKKGNLWQKKLITDELAKMKAGLRNEDNTAYLLDFDLSENKYWYILHDLRLEYNGFAAQIDHLLINVGGIYILEDKSFSDTVYLKESGWTYKYKNKYKGLPSPIEQARRHSDLLLKVINEKELKPKKLGFSFLPEIMSYVTISPTTNIVGELPKNVLKSDTFLKMNRKRIDNIGVLGALNMAGTMMTISQAKKLAKDLCNLHTPKEFNWAAKFKFPNNILDDFKYDLPQKRVSIKEKILKNKKIIKKVQKVQEIQKEKKMPDKLSSSKLAKKLGLSTEEFKQRMIEQGYLFDDKPGNRLTALGIKEGGEFKKKYGGYYVWSI